MLYEMKRGITRPGKNRCCTRKSNAAIITAILCQHWIPSIALAGWLSTMAGVKVVSDRQVVYSHVEARENIARLRNHGGTLAVYWIKSHVGVDENERADFLA